MRTLKRVCLTILVAGTLAVTGCGQTPEPSNATTHPTSGSVATEAVARPSTAPAAAEGSAGVSDTEIRIGSCAALSGQMKSRGQQVVDGGRAYINYVNERGGINGRKINLISNDDAYDPEKAIDCFNELMADKIFAGALFQGTVQAARYLPMGERNNIPLIGFSTGGDFLYEPFHPNIFTVRASYGDEARKQVDTLVNVLGKKKIAIIYQNDAFGAACLRGVQQALEKSHVKAVAEVSLPHLTTDVAAAVNQVKEAAPDAVILGATADALIDIVKFKQQNKWNTTFVCFSVGSDLLLKKAPTESEGILLTQVLPLTQHDLPAVKLFDQLMSNVASGSESGFSAFEGFVDAIILTEGLKRAGKNLTRQAFIKGLESIHDFDAGLGPDFKINFGPDNHNGLRAVFFTVIRNGQAVSVTGWSAFKK